MPSHPPDAPLSSFGAGSSVAHPSHLDVGLTDSPRPSARSEPLALDPMAPAGQPAAPKQRASKPDRQVVPQSKETARNYSSNRVTNSKYFAHGIGWCIISFIPKNLFEQFTRPLNCYFLLIGALQCIPIIAPVNPLSTLVPLAAAFMLTAVKEFYDDKSRYKDDCEFNTKMRQVVRGSELVSIQSQEIRVGDIVRLNGGDDIPCDLFLISSSDPDGFAYIKTVNLDGEIDLKPRCCCEEVLLKQEAGASFKGVVVCAPPDSKVYNFNARLEPGSDMQPVGVSSAQLLLQSCSLQNTEYVYGLAVYTGNETKCGCNKRRPPLKCAVLDERVSRYCMYVFIFQVTIALCLGLYGASRPAIAEEEGHLHWYLAYTNNCNDMICSYEANVVIPMRFFLLTSVMIPLSFKVTIDISKFYVSITIGWDKHMYNPHIDAEVGGCPAKANSTALAEDLGQIEHIMTDKTGTLTENIMDFRCCSIGGHIWGGGPMADEGTCDPQSSALDDPSFIQNLRTGEGGINAFARLLALCHTVSTKDSGKKEEPELVASSPDEEALVLAARRMSHCLVGKTKKEISIIAHGGEVERHLILHVFEFDSDRKMMSMLLRGPPAPSGAGAPDGPGAITLYSKGADDKVMAILDRAVQDPAVAVLPAHLSTFARAGLRTLVLAQRAVPEEEYAAWLPRVQEAGAITGPSRDAALAAVYRDMECGLSLVGVTAIEDRLQTDVPQTIATLRRAGICFWMLTGDKFETAKQIARACNLWDQPSGEELIEVRGSPEQIPARLAEVSAGRAAGAPSTAAGAVRNKPPPRYVIITDGSSLETLLGREQLMDDFARLCLSPGCASVVCSRVTPGQKAEVTRMVKQYGIRGASLARRMLGLAPGVKVLSIGDGGNDVSMIQEAKVGVGIIGKEGRQASRAADYSVSRFHHLRPLLLVHGHNAYVRAAYITQYCFYKSMLMAFVQQLHNFTTLFSGSTFWSSMFLMGWNFFTFPTAFFYVLDRDVPRESLLAHPDLYRYSQSGKALTAPTFFGFILRGQLQAILLFLFTIWTYGDNFVFPADGGPEHLESVYTGPYTAMVLAQTWTIVLESHSITWINALFNFGMPPAYFILILIYGVMMMPGSDGGDWVPVAYWGVPQRLCADPTFWFSIILQTCAMMVPHTVYAHWRQMIQPTPLVLYGLPDPEVAGPPGLCGGAFGFTGISGSGCGCKEGVGDDDDQAFASPLRSAGSRSGARALARQIDVQPAADGGLGRGGAKGPAPTPPKESAPGASGGSAGPLLAPPPGPASAVALPAKSTPPRGGSQLSFDKVGPPPQQLDGAADPPPGGTSSSSDPDLLGANGPGKGESAPDSAGPPPALVPPSGDI